MCPGLGRREDIGRPISTDIESEALTASNEMCKSREEASRRIESIFELVTLALATTEATTKQGVV